VERDIEGSRARGTVVRGDGCGRLCAVRPTAARGRLEYATRRPPATLTGGPARPIFLVADS
jgi:hypothetical protein